MFTTITLRNVGAAAIVLGLLVAVFALRASSASPFVLAWMLVFIGVGLRLEDAVRARRGAG